MWLWNASWSARVPISVFVWTFPTSIAITFSLFTLCSHYTVNSSPQQTHTLKHTDIQPTHHIIRRQYPGVFALTGLICGHLCLRLFLWFINLFFCSFCYRSSLSPLHKSVLLFLHLTFCILISFSWLSCLCFLYFFSHVISFKFSFFVCVSILITHFPTPTVERFADPGGSMSPLQSRRIHRCRQASEQCPHCSATEGGETTGGLQLHWERSATPGSHRGWG